MVTQCRVCICIPLHSLHPVLCFACARQWWVGNRVEHTGESVSEIHCMWPPQSGLGWLTYLSGCVGFIFAFPLLDFSIPPRPLFRRGGEIGNL